MHMAVLNGAPPLPSYQPRRQTMTAAPPTREVKRLHVRGAHILIESIPLSQNLSNGRLGQAGAGAQEAGQGGGVQLARQQLERLQFQET